MARLIAFFCLGFVFHCAPRKTKNSGDGFANDQTKFKETLPKSEQETAKSEEEKLPVQEEDLGESLSVPTEQAKIDAEKQLAEENKVAPSSDPSAQGERPSQDLFRRYKPISAFHYYQEGVKDKELEPKIKHFCGLLSIDIEGLNKEKKWLECSVTEANADSEKWILYAKLGKDADTRLWCSAACLSWEKEGIRTSISKLVEKHEYRGSSTQPLYKTDDSFCLLGSVKFAGVIDHSESAECSIVEKSGSWEVQANYQNQLQGNDYTAKDGGAWCQANCLRWTGKKVSLSDEFTNHSHSSGEKKRIKLKPSTGYFCGLTGVKISGIEKVAETLSCKVEQDLNSWYLRAESKNTENAKVDCSARCIPLQENSS